MASVCMYAMEEHEVTVLAKHKQPEVLPSALGCHNASSLLEVEELEGKGCADVEGHRPCTHDQNLQNGRTQTSAFMRSMSITTSQIGVPSLQPSKCVASCKECSDTMSYKVFLRTEAEAPGVNRLSIIFVLIAGRRGMCTS